MSKDDFTKAELKALFPEPKNLKKALDSREKLLLENAGIWQIAKHLLIKHGNVITAFIIGVGIGLWI